MRFSIRRLAALLLVLCTCLWPLASQAEGFTLKLGGFPFCAADLDPSPDAPYVDIEEPGVRFAAVKAELMRRHGDVTFTRGEITRDDLATWETVAVLTGRDGKTPMTGVDLLTLNNAEFDVLYAEGFLLDLAQSDLLRQTLLPAALPPHVTDGKRLYAVPKLLQLPMLYLNEDAPEALHNAVMETEDWTWAALLELGHTVAAYNQAQGSDFVLLCQTQNTSTSPYFLSVLIASQADQDVKSSALLKTLAAYKDALEIEQVSFVFDQTRERQPRERPALLTLHNGTCGEMGDRTVLPLPGFEGIEERYVARGQYYVIPANAQHVTEALEYLEIYVSEAVQYADQTRDRYGLVLGDSFPYSVSAENLDLWQQAASQATHNGHSWTKDMDAVLEAYLSGSGSLEDCVKAFEE